MTPKAKPRLCIELDFCIVAAAFLLIIPLRFVLSIMFAILLHELGHYVALKVFNVEIHSISISGCGIKMHTERMSHMCELVCSLAGPAAGLSLYATLIPPGIRSSTEFKIIDSAA